MPIQNEQMPETANKHPDAIFEATLAGVPRSGAEIEQLLSDRPPEWEWRYFAAALMRGRDELAFKWYDHEMGIGVLGGPDLDHLAASDYVRIHEIETIVERLGTLLQPDVLRRAFGGPHASGDPNRIEHLGQRIVDCYEDLLDWAARIRGARVPEAFEAVFTAAAHLADQPAEGIRAFIDEAVRRGDEIPALIAAGMPIPRELPPIFGKSDDAAHHRFHEALRAMSRDWT